MYVVRLVLPWVLGVLLFWGGAIVYRQIEGPPRCNSGWESPSIGRRGACSHHGGVAPQWKFAGAMATGVGGWYLSSLMLKVGQSKPTPVPPPTPKPPPPPPRPAGKVGPMKYGRHCSKCKSGMRAINVLVGPPPHGPMWECLNEHCRHSEPREA